jgi:vacuolar protein sorting-associated protein 52
VLEAILGGPPRKTVSGQEGVTKSVPAARPVELVGDIDFRGLSLQAFVEAESDTTQRISRVHTYSAQSVEECTFIPSTYIHSYSYSTDGKEKDKFEDLHRSILV